MANTTSFMDDLVKGVKDIGNVLHSNQAINKIGKNLGGGIEVGARLMGKGGFEKADGITKALSDTFKHKDGTLNYGKIAGSYIGVSAAARVATGGGLYKDRNGNTNIAGVPFI